MEVETSLSSVFVSNHMFFGQSVAKMNAYFDLLEVDHLKVTSVWKFNFTYCNSFRLSFRHSSS